MEANVGGLDRIARLVLGPVLGLVGLGVSLGALPGSGLAGAAVGLVGLVLLGTGITQRCLLHSVLGIDTCPRE